jgi:two-component system, OmpR family, heavy metal sensor histidine kinase CusS
MVRIEVTDTGDGIPAEALPRVFDRFFRVDPSRSQASGGTSLGRHKPRAARASGGTGLGLAIVQGIMLLHGGKVEIVSQPGKGTRVILSMPASAPP